MKYFLGIDVGSSKTHALIVDEAGRCCGFGMAGGGNHQGVGYQGLENVIIKSYSDARDISGISTDQIAGAGFGVSGYDFLSDRDGHLKAIGVLGLSCPFEVVNDGVNGLLAGATLGIGVNVTAGSSNNCRGRNKAGWEGRIVGNGAAFGEYGGGIEIVSRALQEVNYAWIKRSSPTMLTKVFLDYTGARDELELMEGFSTDYFHLTPYLAVEIIRVAREGDLAAQEIIKWTGEELGWLAVSVARQINMADDEVEIVQSGSIFEAGSIITNPMREIVIKHCPKAKLFRLDGPPVVGSVILGMEQAHFDGYSVRANLVRSAKEIVK
jgi:N-acetylglucosamine kinase-like BadF-type ATPase